MSLRPVVRALLLLAFVASACGDDAPPPSDGKLLVAPATAQIPVGLSVQFELLRSSGGDLGVPLQADGGSVVAWTSSDPSIASVAASGLATGHKPGKVTITAVTTGGSAAAELEVIDASLSSLVVQPGDARIPIGVAQPFQAIGRFTDGTMREMTSAVRWSSSDTAVAAVGSDGMALGNTEGVTTITASVIGGEPADGGDPSSSDGGAGGEATTATAKLTVVSAVVKSIDVSPSSFAIAAGLTQQLVATGKLSDGTTQDVTSLVAWTSTQETVAKVSNDAGKKGLVTALSSGTAEIVATLTFGGSSVAGRATINISAASLKSIQVNPPSVVLPAGTSKPLAATATFSDGTTQDVTQQVSWSSSDKAVATVDDAKEKGLLRAGQAGKATITAQLMTVSGTATVDVTPAMLVGVAITPTNPQVPVGNLLQLQATGTFSDGTTQDLTATADWSSSDAATAAVGTDAGRRGQVTGVKVGAATITAAQAGQKATTVVAVTSAKLTAVLISPANAVVAKGSRQQLSATGVYSDQSSLDVTSSVTWSSSDPAIAGVSNVQGSKGLATALQAGTVTVRAALAGVEGSTSLTVTTASLVSITISPAALTMAKGTSQPLTATGIYSDQSNQDLTSSVTWSSSSASVANVSNVAGNQGLVSGLATGSATITATLGGVSGSAKVTVSAATLSAISITPSNPTVAKGTTQQLEATGTYSDGSTQDLTSSVSWASTDPKVVTVSNAAGSQGLVSAVAMGSTKVTASLGGVSGSTKVTVTVATLASITVGPTGPTLAKGTSLQMQATGTFSDGSTQDVTSAATWTTSNGGVATVSNGVGSQGLVQAVGTGSATITAALSGVSGGTLVLVTSAKLSSIALTPSNPTVAAGSKVQFTATGVFSDGTTQNLTSAATWASSVEGVATVSNADGTQGLATTSTAGKTQISAALSGVTGGTTLTVTTATLLAIEVTPSTASIAAGFTKAFSARGVYSDGSTQNLTSVVTWRSSDTNVATVSNAGGSQGLATGLAAGNAEISASLSGVSGKGTLSVSAALLQSISVAPDKVSTPKGTTVQFKATGSFSDSSTQDLTSQVSWSSSAQSVATISNVAPTQGLATAVSAGSTTITATKSGISGTAALTVTAGSLVSIEVQPANPSVPKGATQQFTAIGKYSDGSTQTITAQVTWSSSSEAVATISNAGGSQGVATAQQVGMATITASLGGVQGKTGITVIAAVLQSIAVSPQSATIRVGQTRQFSATGRYSDGTTDDITTSATWTSSKLTVATIGATGLAEGKSQGMTSITAAKSGVTSSAATLNVMP